MAQLCDPGKSLSFSGGEKKRLEGMISKSLSHLAILRRMEFLSLLWAVTELYLIFEFFGNYTEFGATG